MRLKKKETAQSAPARPKWPWVLGTVLLLALPLFSYFSAERRPVPAALVARVDLPAPERATLEATQPTRPAAVERYSAFGGVSTRTENTNQRSDSVARKDPPPPLTYERRRSAPVPAVAVADTIVTRATSLVRQVDRLSGSQSLPERGLGDQLPVVPGPLNDLQQGYQQAYSTVFPNAGFAPTSQNPFEEALSESDPDPQPADDATTEDPPSEDPVQQPDQPDPETTNPDPETDPEPDPEPEPQPEPDPEPEPPPETPAPDPDPPADPDPAPETETPQPEPPRRYRFLLVGDYESGAGNLVSRANLGGSLFTFENGFQLSFFPGSIHSILAFELAERVITFDLNGDGLTDFFSSRTVESVGSSLESYLQVAPGRFELHASTVLYLQAINSIAVLDLDRDGEQELVALIEGSDNLFVFERHQLEWRLSQELPVPFRPGLILATNAGAARGERALHVIDETLNYVVTLSPRQPDLFRFGSRAALNRTRLMALDWFGDGEQPVMVITLPDGIVLAEERARSLHLIGAFDTRSLVPQVIVGDYAGSGGRQTLWIP